MSGFFSLLPPLLAVLFLTCPASSRAAFDLATTMEVSKVGALVPGEEILVSITVHNLGPDDALNAIVSGGQGTEEEYLYRLVASESPVCGPAEELETDPPAYSFYWNPPLIPAGGAVTCIARLSIVRAPYDAATILYAGAERFGDIDPSNNFTQVSLGFATGTRTFRVPALSWWSWVVAGCCILVAANLRRS